MHLFYENVNYAFKDLIERAKICYFELNPSTDRSSRNGDVIKIASGPVIVTYANPTNRVLFNEFRDCNPFFHLYESIWMLAGKNDVESLVTYNPRMRTYSDDNKTLHGAYGWRWRNHFGFDQLAFVIQELKLTPNSRRAVVQMWEAEDLKVAQNGGLDVPCNLEMLFEINDNCLDMTVFNRSNDLIWGMLGANAVHFSYVQQYVAEALELSVGCYHQVSNNLHIYKDIWDKYKNLPSEQLEISEEHRDLMTQPSPALVTTNESRASFDKQCNLLLQNEDVWCSNKFLRTVVSPMLLAWRHHKNRDYTKALEATEFVLDKSWQYVAKIWLKKRRDNYMSKLKRNP